MIVKMLTFTIIITIIIITIIFIIHVHLVASSGRGLASHKGKEFVWSTQASIRRFQAPSKGNILVIQITDTKI